MNKQRKVVITTTYNEMGIIIDTKAEEVTQPNLQPTCNRLATDCISRQVAIDALWKALYEYEDKTAKKFQESEDLDIQDWIEHRIFVQNMNDIDRQTILNLPPIQPERKKGEWSDGYRWQRCSLCKQTGARNHGTTVRTAERI